MTFHNKQFQNREHKVVSQEKKEEYAIILDVVLANQSSFNNDEIAQAIGTTKFSLLELVPKQGVILKSGQKVYIGDGKRDEIQYIKRSLFPDKMSSSAKSELEFALKDIVIEKEKEYVDFFNTAGPISLRMHSLELIPSIGKKHTRSLIDEREIRPFESFDDIKQRCTFFSDPVKSIVERIITEIETKEDIKIFVRR